MAGGSNTLTVCYNPIFFITEVRVMAVEIERRFLVTDTRILAGRQGERIVQGYVAKEPGAMCTRVRIRAGRGCLTLKGPRQSLSRDEFEYEIPLDDAFRILAAHCGNRIVLKTRYLVEFSAHLFEVDVFEGRHAGLVIAEVELPSEDTAMTLPTWVGDEVTHDSRYGNFYLAQGGEPHIVPVVQHGRLTDSAHSPAGSAIPATGTAG